MGVPGDDALGGHQDVDQRVAQAGVAEVAAEHVAQRAAGVTSFSSSTPSTVVSRRHGEREKIFGPSLS